MLLVYADYVNILERKRTYCKNADALKVASKEIGLEVNSDKSKYMVVSRYQNAGRSQNIKADNSSFERVKELKYLGTNLNDSQLYSGRN